MSLSLFDSIRRQITDDLSSNQDTLKVIYPLPDKRDLAYLGWIAVSAARIRKVFVLLMCRCRKSAVKRPHTLEEHLGFSSIGTPGTSSPPLPAPRWSYNPQQPKVIPMLSGQTHLHLHGPDRSTKVASPQSNGPLGINRSSRVSDRLVPCTAGTRRTKRPLPTCRLSLPV